MESFCLLMGHLIGDYIFQVDAIASRKTTSSAICALHCFLYSLAIWIMNEWWIPMWAVVVVGLLHFPVDRWRLARRYMSIVGQEQFATGPLAPWSVVLVDNVFHLFVLAIVGRMI